MSLQIEVGDALFRSIPVAAAGVAEATARHFGLTLHEWFYVASILYILIQGWAVIYKTIKGGDDDE